MSGFPMRQKVWFSAGADKRASSDPSFDQADVAVCFGEDLSPEQSLGCSGARWTKPPHHHPMYSLIFLSFSSREPKGFLGHIPSQTQKITHLPIPRAVY